MAAAGAPAAAAAVLELAGAGPYRVYFAASPHECLGFDQSGKHLVLEPADPLNPRQKWEIITGNTGTFGLRNLGTGLDILKAHASSELLADPMFFHAGALGEATRFQVAGGAAELGAGIPVRVAANGTDMRKALEMELWEPENNINHGDNVVPEAPANGGGVEDKEAGEGHGGPPPKTRSKSFFCCF